MLLVFIEGPCIRKTSNTCISALRSSYADIYDLLGELRKEGHYVPITALNLFSEIYTRLPRIYSLLRSSIGSLQMFFITPLGVFAENDPTVCYEECFAELSPSQIDYVFSKFKTKEKIYDILEGHYDFSIFCMSSKLIKSLDIEFYFPKIKPALIVSDSYVSSKENIYCITMNHFFTRKLKKIHAKISLYDLYQLTLEYIAKAVDDLKKREYNLRAFLSNPQDLFQTLFSPTLLTKLISEPKQKRILKYL